MLRDGRPHPVRVTTGLRDGSNVEITGGDLKAGDQVIVNEIAAADAKTARRRGAHLRF